MHLNCLASFKIAEPAGILCIAVLEIAMENLVGINVLILFQVVSKSANNVKNVWNNKVANVAMNCVTVANQSIGYIRDGTVHRELSL